MSLFQHVIVPFDFSPPSEQSLLFAKQLAAMSGARLHVVHGMKLPYRIAPKADEPHLKTVAEVKAHVTARLAARMDAMGVAAAQTVDARPIEEWLDEYAHALPASLIVLARHGWRQMQRGLGPHAKLILRNARTPVWLVANAPGEVKHVVACVDLQAHSAPLAAFAKQVTLAFGARLELVHARPTFHEAGYLQEVSWHDPLPDAETHYAAERAKLAELAASLAAGGFNAETRLLLGRTDEAIAAEALKTQTELLVLGKHNRGALVRFLLGSTTERLAGETDGHVLVVP